MNETISRSIHDSGTHPYIHVLLWLEHDLAAPEGVQLHVHVLHLYLRMPTCINEREKGNPSRSWEGIETEKMLLVYQFNLKHINDLII